VTIVVTLYSQITMERRQRLRYSIRRSDHFDLWYCRRLLIYGVWLDLTIISKIYCFHALFLRYLLTSGFQLCQIVFFGVLGRTYYGYKHNIYLRRKIVLLYSFCRSLKYHISRYSHTWVSRTSPPSFVFRIVNGVFFLERRTNEFHTYLTITQCSSI